MCIIRRGGHREGVAISDHVWTAWTGLDPRSKELAMNGLRKKAFAIEGRGDRARMTFNRPAFESFAKAAERGTKPRTEGRKVDPRPGQKIHPDCQSGCALLQQSPLTLVPASCDAKPVSQNTPLAAASNGHVGAAASGVGPGVASGLTLVPAIQNAKPVSQKAKTAALELWVLSLAALHAVFPVCGRGFLVRLVAVVCKIFSDVTDEELARAITFAWKNKRSQHSEGLFLYTVPDAVAALRRLGGPPKHVDITAGLRSFVVGASDALRARGEPYIHHAEDLEGVVKTVEAAGALNFEAVEAELERIEFAVYETAAVLLSPADRATVDELVGSAMRDTVQARASIRGDELEVIRGRVSRLRTLEVLRIPRLSWP